MNKELDLVYKEMNKLVHFKHPPILLGGKVLEYYGIRKSDDYDFMIHKNDVKTLESLVPKQFKKFKGMNPDKMWSIIDKNLDEKQQYPIVYPADDLDKFWIDFRGDIGGIDVFQNISYIDYDFLAAHATNHKKIMIASLPDIILLKNIVMNITGPMATKAKKDIKLIIKYLEKNY